MAPPHTVNAVKLTIAKVEKIRVKDRKSISLFLTPYSQSPMANAGKVTILNLIGPGSTPHEPLALVAKMIDFAYVPEEMPQEMLQEILQEVPQEVPQEMPQEIIQEMPQAFEPEWPGIGRPAEALYAPLEPQGRGGLASAAEPDTTSPEIRYRMSIQHSYFPFHILTVGGSVLSALHRQL